MEHPAAFAAPLRYETLTVWTRDSWTRYRRPMKDKENTEYALSENGERRHGLGAVPLVPFLFEPDLPHDRAPRHGRCAVPDPAHLQTGLGTRQDASTGPSLCLMWAA